jgi:hypothetical protein
MTPELTSVIIVVASEPEPVDVPAKPKRPRLASWVEWFDAPRRPRIRFTGPHGEECHCDG